MDTLKHLGFEAITVTINFIFGEMWSSDRRVWIRHGTSGREFLFIAGFNQPSESWEWFIRNVIRKDDTIFVIERRRTENRSWWRNFVGWTPLWFQRLEVKLIYQKLLERQVVHPGATIICHSVGAIMARDLAAEFPNDVGDIIQIAPVPDKYGTLWNWSFWKNGGLAAVIPSLIGFVLPFIGLRVSRNVTRGLYTGANTDSKTVTSYHATLVADSPLVFYALVGWYRLFGRNQLELAQKRGWYGTTTRVICAGDAIFPAPEFIVNPPHWSYTLFLYRNTPHCYWFVDHRAGSENAARLKMVIYGGNRDKAVWSAAQISNPSSVR